MSVERVLGAIVQRIVESCDPDEVLLFGSHAKGLADWHSDIDLLVIGAFRESPRHRGRELRRLLQQLPVRVDLHLITPAEMNEHRGDPRSFPASVLGGAVVLFKRGPRTEGDRGGGGRSAHAEHKKEEPRHPFGDETQRKLRRLFST